MRPMTVGDLERGDMAVLHRPVRLGIAAEYCCDPQDSGAFPGVVARTFLMEPRCAKNHELSNEFKLGRVGNCECGPLAEKRIG